MRTTTEIHKAIIGQLEATLGKALPIFPKAFIRVLSKILAGAFVLMDKYVGFMMLQLFITTATWEEIDVDGTPMRPLVTWGERFGVSAPVEAIAAELRIKIFTVVGGDIITVGTPFIHRPSGLLYLCTVELPLITPSRKISVKCTTPGVRGTLDDTAVLEFFDKPPGATSISNRVSDIDVVGVDGETEEEYRQRVLDRSKQVPDGGAPGHYRKWALEAGDDITKAYAYTGSTVPASVDLYLDTEDGTPPSAPQIAVVQAYVDLKAPVGDKVYAQIVTRTALVANVFGFTASSPSNQIDAEDLAEEAIENYIADREPFIENVSVPPRRDVVSSGEAHGLVTKAANSINAHFSSMQLTESGSPFATYPLGEGERVTITVNFV